MQTRTDALPSRGHERRPSVVWRRVCIAALLALISGACGDLVNGGTARQARLLLQLTNAQRAETRDIVVRITYRSAGQSRNLLIDTLQVDVTATQAPVTFDIAPCFKDGGREVTTPPGGCRIYVDLTLRNAAGTILDTEVSAPLDVSATATTVTVPPLALREVNSVRVLPMPYALAVGDTITLSATALDTTGTVLPGRELTWSTSAPSVATVSATGALRVLAAGTVIVRATRESRTDSLVLSTWPRVQNTRCSGRLTQLSVGQTPADTVIRVAQSPYRMVATATVRSGAQTRVEPGVVICADQMAGIAAVDGTVLARGTAASRILLTAADTTIGWIGIALAGTIADSSRFENVDIEYVGASTGVNAVFTRQFHPVVLQDVRIRRGRPNIGVFLSGSRAGGRLLRVTIDSIGASVSPTRAAVYLGNRFVTIDSLIIRQSPGFGIFLGQNSDTVPLTGGLRLRGVYIRGAVEEGISVTSNLPVVSVANVAISGTRTPLMTMAGFQTGWSSFSSTQLTGNQRDTIDVIRGDFTGVLRLHAGIPWRINSALVVGAQSQLVVDAGARVAFAVLPTTPGINISNAGSSMAVTATGANPAILTTPSPTQRWGGISWQNVTGTHTFRGLTVRRGSAQVSSFLLIAGTGALFIDESIFDDVVAPLAVVQTTLAGTQSVTRSTFLNTLSPNFALAQSGSGPAIVRSTTFDNAGRVAYSRSGPTGPLSATLDSIQITNTPAGLWFQQTTISATLSAINFDGLSDPQIGAILWPSTQTTLDARNLWWGSSRTPPTSGPGSVSGNVLVTPNATKPHIIPRQP